MCSLVNFAMVRLQLYWWQMQVEIRRYRARVCVTTYTAQVFCSAPLALLISEVYWVISFCQKCQNSASVIINGIWAKSGQKRNMCGSRNQKRCWPRQANNPCCNVALSSSSLANFTCYALIFTPSDKETAVKFDPRRPVSNMTAVHDAAQNYAQRCPEAGLLSRKNCVDELKWSAYWKSELIGVLGTCREWMVNMWKFLQCQETQRTLWEKFEDRRWLSVDVSS